MSTPADVAAQLKDVRLAAGLSQTELARRASVSRTTVARMETVAKGDMSVSVLVRLPERLISGSAFADNEGADFA